MPIYLGNQAIGTEYVDSYAIGNLYLGTASLNDFVSPFFNGRGGQITTSGDYIIHTFTSSATFSTINLGLAPSNSIEYLIVGGGGGGGKGRGGEGFNATGGGGGAGGTVRTGSLTPTSSSYSIVIGSGGVGVGSDVTTNAGGTSSFAGVIATGGQSFTQGTSQAGKNADFNSGSAYVYFTSRWLGGGAGAGANGGDAGVVGSPTSASAGNGGDGVLSSINGTATYYGGGGGGGVGGAAFPPVQGVGGLGGGGNGGVGGCFTKPAAATANSGGGGGGNAYSNCLQTSGDGGDGADGIVILRYKYK